MLGQREREREGESRYKESYLKAERGELDPEALESCEYGTGTSLGAYWGLQYSLY